MIWEDVKIMKLNLYFTKISLDKINEILTFDLLMVIIFTSNLL